MSIGVAVGEMDIWHYEKLGPMQCLFLIRSRFTWAYMLYCTNCFCQNFVQLPSVL